MERAPGECVLCGGTDRVLLLREGEWTVFRCAGCGLGVLDPRPGPDELAELYGESYFLRQYERVPEPGSEKMKRRLAVGFDVSNEAAASVQETLGISVKTGMFREELFAPGSIDVVTMCHALEHMPDPRVPLDLAWKWLMPDGVLVVDVPNYECTDARKAGQAWVGWQLPYHFFRFTPTSAAGILDRCGFRVLGSKTYHSEYVKERLKRIPLLGLLARPIAKLHTGTSVAIVAKKSVRPDAAGGNAPSK
jgi:SAM-dependent methyltransferase